ncbi:MAG: VWA domain-containing protein, partial [Boseongicola sp.]|nr:VWA domain-containing protein [Boseongicola sp.]
MSDDFDDLKAAMTAATPEPDAAKKAANLVLAEENFARLQESMIERRPMFERGLMARLGHGVKTMLNVMTTRVGLTLTTGLVAVGLVLVLPVGKDLLRPPVELVAPGTAVVSVDKDGAVVEERDAGSTLGNESIADALEDPAPVVQRQAEAQLADDLAAPEAMVAEESFAAPSPAQSLGRSRGESELLMVPDAKRLVVPSDVIVAPESDTEAFANAEESSLKVTLEEPVSTFSIDVDTASYSVVRSSLTRGMLPPREAVRVEEMMNYFPYDYPESTGPDPFEPTITVMPSPWNAGTNLVHIGIQGDLPLVEDRPPLNLVFLIDTSGSMQDANKLPLLQQSFRLMLAELRPEDEVSIVTYAGSAGQVLEPTPAAERTKIIDALSRLSAGGSTAGQAGLQQAYQAAEAMAADGEITRVILATDGDFNVGISDPDALKDFIAQRRESGTYLSVLGFGRGNLDDATMQALAQNGNGTASYIDTLAEARKVLVDQLTGALFPIANDVKIQVEFNPAEIAEYRLIGYETRALRREDFNNDRVDAGEIGAGHTVTAIYEVTPVGSDAVRSGPLRYSDTEVAG